MMDEQLGFDAETGELPPRPLTERMIAAGVEAREHAEREAILAYNTSLNAALLEVSKKLNPWITTDKDNAAFKRDGKALKYASLKTILETVRPLLLDHGILLRQGQDKSWSLDEGGGSRGRLIPVYTDLVHVATGRHDRTIIEIPLMVSSPQAMGSAITYGRRYSLLAALGITTDEADDDGEAAKLKDMSERSSDSADLVALKADMDKITDASKLTEWGNATPQKKRLSSLSEAEQERARFYFTERGRAILNGEIPTPAPKKGKAAE